MPSSQTAILSCHASAVPGLDAISVRVTRTVEGGLALAYCLQGEPGRLAIPTPGTTGFADGLWQHTCCEVFVGVAGSPAYREFNFSPSGQWAAYAFTGYRQRDESFRPPQAPVIAVRRLADRLELDARVPPALLPSAPWELGLAAVVEAADGGKSYWALAHPGPQPDFHLRAAFTLDLTFPTP